jgi:ubiquinone/menaquinone biosynthesis C-methylase UbiE
LQSADEFICAPFKPIAAQVKENIMEHNHSATDHKHPDYDFHMPRLVTYPLPVLIASVIVGGSLFMFLRESQPKLAIFTAGISIGLGMIYAGIFAMLNRITNLERRLSDRDKLLEEIPWQGNETILDVGCGNGILLLGAVKQLPSGKGIGIDIWTEGSGDNRPEIFLENAKIEGVADRVSLQNEDARKLPYDNESFDVVISGLTMHHMKTETNKAMEEMARVLKPGGWMAIYDEPSTVFYCAKLMRQNGLQIKKKYADMVFGTKMLSNG